jgi:cytochrome c553
MWDRSLILLVSVAACSQARGDDPPDTGRFKHHMREHSSDVRTIEHMLVHGKLAEAKALAFLLTMPSSVPQTPERRELVLAAGALTIARTLEDAMFAQAGIANACARCHASAERLPVFTAPSHAPSDRPTVVAQMARHRWAVDRLWEGMIGASDEHWRAGLYVFATSPLPSTLQAERDVALQLRALARDALERKPALSLDERTALYGEILITCARCHTAARARRLQRGK